MVPMALVALWVVVPDRKIRTDLEIRWMSKVQQSYGE
jgi:hypothetical protein